MGGAILVGSRINNCNFEQANMQNCNMTKMKMDDCKLNQANVNEGIIISGNICNSVLDYASFKSSRFTDAVIKDTTMIDVNMDGSALDRAQIKDINLEGTDMRNCGLTDTDLRGSSLFRIVITGSDVEYARIDNIVSYEIEGDFKRAQDVYRNLKNTFRNNGAHNRASYFSIRESKMSRKMMAQEKNYGIWALLYFYEIISGYGESPLRVFVTTISAILIFSAIFASMPEGLENVEGKDISTTDYLYYSVVTFTTLGYGDIVPVDPLTKMLAVTEALFGVFLMSLLVVTLSRRIIT
jgi:uncharacterized protein YjbI with pentapeptide repeats